MIESNFTKAMDSDRLEPIPKWMGLSDYKASLEIQHNIINQVRESGQSQILGFEYERTVTAGLQVKPDEIAFLEKAIHPQGYQVFATPRGGQFTLHGRGQLVIYPIVDLKAKDLGVRDFITMCLETTVLLLRDNGVKSYVDLERAGVYTAKGKIAFCGFKIDRGISSHGISINIHNDLEEFKLITPCGVSGLTLDRLAPTTEMGVEHMKYLFHSWTSFFQKVSNSND